MLARASAHTNPTSLAGPVQILEQNVPKRTEEQIVGVKLQISETKLKILGTKLQ